MKSMCLVPNGLRLSREAYMQGTLALWRTRKRLATLIWEIGVNSEAKRWSPQENPAATRCEAPSAGRESGPRIRPRAAVRGTEGRVTLGKKAPRRRWWGRKKQNSPTGRRDEVAREAPSRERRRRATIERG